jgi:hypothetical protein
MTDRRSTLLRDLFHAIRRSPFRTHARITRYRRSLHYALGTLSVDEAQQILIDCEYPAGWHPILTLTVEDTLEQALEDLVDHPELRRLIADGCARVGRKLVTHGDELYEARRWAVDLAQEYARDEGITLVRRDDGPAAESDSPS